MAHSHIAQYAHGMEGSITPIGLSGYGREQTTKLDVDMQTSFRMEALGMLAGIKYLREELNWQGKVK